MNRRSRYMDHASRRARETAFTLIEILVVIGILAMLFVALLPMITGAEEKNRIATTQTMIASLESAAKGYERQRRFGDYPPDDFRDTTGKLRVPRGNATNVGIESFVWFVNRADSQEKPFPEREEWLGNTDGDKGKPANAKLDRLERLEILDAWGNPFAYFHHRNYTKEQSYRLNEEAGDLDEVEQPVTAWKDASRFFNLRSFQIFSAGPDGVYGTSDDIANFPIPQED